MRLVAGVLTYRVDDYGRRDLFDRTIASIETAMDGRDDVELVVFDNSHEPNPTIGHGMNRTVEKCLEAGADIVVRSDDDVEWSPNFVDQLRHVWADAPANVILCGCHVEPVYPWSRVTRETTLGTLPALYRTSVPGGSWSFLASSWATIGPVPDVDNQHSDVPTCQRLTAQGFWLAQVDLASHIGGDRSCWGNTAHEWGNPVPSIGAPA